MSHSFPRSPETHSSESVYKEKKEDFIMDAEELGAEIHIWDFPDKTTVQISNEFLDKIIAKRKQLFKSWKSFYESLNCYKISFAYFKAFFNPSFKTFRPLSYFTLACKKLNIDLSELEKSIIAYRTGRSRIVIVNPKLPIKVNPIFSMLVAHAIADGCLTKFKNKDTVYLCYTQCNKKLRKLFVSKSESVFGKIQYPKDYFETSIRAYLPVVTTLIIMDHFGLNNNSFIEDKAEIPKKIFAMSKKHLLATLIGFIIDEGHIDSGQIDIGLNSEKLIKQLVKICELLDYEYTVSTRGSTGYDLYILKNGFEKFWRDYLELKKEYSEVNMGYKEKAINRGIIRMEKTWRNKGHNQTKNLIIEILKKKPRTVNKLARLLKVTRQGIRYHLKQLEEEYIIMRNEKGKQAADIYHLNRYIKFPESNKGQSRQLNSTNQKIRELLSKSPMTTTELVDGIGLRRDSLMNLLYNLERKKEIKRIGTKKTIAHPTVLWQINKENGDFIC